MNNVIEIFYDPEYDCYGFQLLDGFHKADKEGKQMIIGELITALGDCYDAWRDGDEA